MLTPRTFDPDSGSGESRGAILRPLWPVDAVVGFLHLHAPRLTPHSAVRVLEIGCGARGDVSFAAREGFDTTGVETTTEALERARECLREEGLDCELHVVDPVKLPFQDGVFDLAIDHGALSGLGRSQAQRALRELARVLKPSGRLFFNPSSDRDSGAREGRVGSDGLTLDVHAGPSGSSGSVCFWSADQVTAALVEDWRVLSRQHVEFEEQDRAPQTVHAEWRLVVEKVA